MIAGFRKSMKWFSRLFGSTELNRLDRQQVDELAHDIGVTRDQLMTMEARGSKAGVQLSKRMQVLHKDENNLPVSEWATLRDMQRVCSVCGSKWQCEKDLRERPEDSKWEDYCPNAETLRSLAKR